MGGRARAWWLAKRVAVVIVSCTFVTGAVLWLLQDRFVYGRSVPARVDPAAEQIEVIGYDSSDGVYLEGWLRRATSTGCAPAPMVVVLHGNFTDKTWGVPLARELNARGLDVFLAEYRGFGGSPGSPSEAGLIDDGVAAVAAARSASTDPGQAPVVLGLSLGTGVAAGVALREPVGGLILVAPYTSIADVAWAELPLLPYGLLLRDDYRTIDKMPDVQVPTLVVASEDDDLIPVGQSRAVHATAARPGPYLEVSGVDHITVVADVGSIVGGELATAVRGWSACEGGT